MCASDRLRCGPAAGRGLSPLSPKQASPWFRPKPAVRAAQAKTQDGSAPRRHPLGEGVLIRRARHIRLLSGYL